MLKHRATCDYRVETDECLRAQAAAVVVVAATEVHGFFFVRRLIKTIAYRRIVWRLYPGKWGQYAIQRPRRRSNFVGRVSVYLVEYKRAHRNIHGAMFIWIKKKKPRQLQHARLLKVHINHSTVRFLLATAGPHLSDSSPVPPTASHARSDFLPERRPWIRGKTCTCKKGEKERKKNKTPTRNMQT